MPSVPRYDSPKVNQAPVPNVRLSPEVPLEAFGGGRSLAVAGATGQELINDVQQVVFNEKQKADDLVTQDAYAKLLGLKNRLIYDTKDGVMTRRGKDAFGAPDEFGTRFDEGAKEIEGGLFSDGQRQMFQKMKLKERVEFDGAVQRHVFQESERLQDDVFKSLSENLINDAVQNMQSDGKVPANIALLKTSAVDYARKKGMDPQQTQALADDLASKTHVGVIDRFIAQENYDAAKNYFAQNQKEILGIKLADVERTIGKTTEENTKELYLQATNVVDKNPGIEPRYIVPSWQKLTLEQRNALESRSEDRPNDDKTWLDFLDVSVDNLGKLSRADFETQYWAKFDKAHRTRAEERWKTAQDAAGKGGMAKNPQLTATLSFDDQVRDTLFLAKMIPDKSRTGITGEKEKLYSRFEQSAAEELEHFELTQLGGKRKATREEIQKMLDGLVLKTVFVDKFGRDPEKPAAALTEEEKAKAYVPVEKIPEVDRATLTAVFQKAGKTPTPDQIQRAYAAYLLNDKKLLDAVLAE